MPKYDWSSQSNPGNLSPTHLDGRTFEKYLITDEMRLTWLEVDGLTGPTGKRREATHFWRDAVFGGGEWRQGWRYRSTILGRTEALQLYEDAYLAFLRTDGKTLDWICQTASEVYDNDVSNVESGLDYGVQEAEATHLQDIAVRRCLVRLGRQFEGRHLVQIRGHDSEGFVLNPGQVPFHEPAEISSAGSKPTWWKPNSVEAFWQLNKILLVNPDELHAQPIAVGPEGLWCRLDEDTAILLPRDSGRQIRTERTRRVRSWLSVPREKRCHAKVRQGSRMSYAELSAVKLPEMPLGCDPRLTWGVELTLKA